MKNKKIIRIALVTAFILMVPLVAMQFTTGVNWSVFDFIVMGVLLFSTGLAYELIASKGSNTVYRVAAGVAIGTAFLLIWVNLAVGFIGSGANPANLMYAGVPVIGIVGAVVAQFRPRGMARALFATALAQVLVPVIALIIEKSQVASGEVSLEFVKALGLTGFFAALWVASALLFRHSGSAPANASF